MLPLAVLLALSSPAPPSQACAQALDSAVRETLLGRDGSERGAVGVVARRDAGLFVRSNPSAPRRVVRMSA